MRFPGATHLTFSTNKREFPPEIAKPDASDPHLWTLGAELQRRIKHVGFSVNPAKTHMQYRTSRQEVTGLVVNQKINVRHEYRHDVRAMVHSLFSTGRFELYGPVERNGIATMEKRQGTLSELHGRLGFIDSVDLYNKKNAQPPQKPSQLSKKEGVYRQFLIYKDFYTAERPVIMCEGDTDNVYLKYAIRSLAPQFPELAEVALDGKITMKVRLYKYPRSSTARILGLHDGGNTALHSFIATYTRDIGRFKAPGQKKPVIILYDSDSGAPKIRSAVEQAAHVKLKGTEEYVHVVRNLYAMPTPLLNGSRESKIEDFFDAATKATVLGGKTFIDRNKFDITKHYGKGIFAEHVVKAKANSISFAGFQPLLTVLEKIIKDHAKAVSGVAAQTS